MRSWRDFDSRSLWLVKLWRDANSRSRTTFGDKVGPAVAKSEQQLSKFAEKAGYSAAQITELINLVAQFEQNAELEDYLAIRQSFPELRLSTKRFLGVSQTYSLLADPRGQEFGHEVMSRIYRADENAIDAVSLKLMQWLSVRRKLPAKGRGYLVARRDAVSEAFVDYVLAIMLEGLASEAKIPHSIMVLIRDRLCGAWPDLYATHLSRKKQWRAASNVVKRGVPARVSVNKLAKAARIPHSTAQRWLKDDDFQKILAAQRRLSSS